MFMKSIKRAREGIFDWSRAKSQDVESHYHHLHPALCFLHRRGGAREGRGAQVRGALSCSPELEEASQPAAGPRSQSGTGV